MDVKKSIEAIGEGEAKMDASGRITTPTSSISISKSG
jgi:hypothetical protein